MLPAVAVFGSLWAVTGPSGPVPVWEEYARDPDRHPQVPNNSYAGHRYGEEAPPDLPVAVRVTDHGAVPDDGQDDTAAFRNALAAAGPGGGAVFVPEGTYHLSAPLFLHHSGQVLRGESREKTILFFNKPLEDAYGRCRLGDKSRWSWSGGMVWIVPPEIRPLQFPGEDSWSEGWKPGEVLAAVSAPAARGDTRLTVRDAAKLRPGMKVLLRLRAPVDGSLYAHFCGDVPGTRAYPWATKAAGLFWRPDWHWPVEIVRVEGGTVHLRQPLRGDVRPEWNPELAATGPLVTGSGVERLTLAMAPARLSAHLLNPGWNGIYFENAWDCWAREVVVKDADNGIGTAAAKCITVDRFTITGRDIHHATFCREQSHDTLWTRFTINNRWIHHGINVEGLSSGNVWSSGEMTHGTFDSHRALPFDAVRTDIRISNQGSQGGGGDAGPLFGARFVHWNVQVTNGRPHMVNAPNMMPRGAVVGVRGAPVEPKPYPDFSGDLQTVIVETAGPVEPANLHLAQLELRTGRPPVHLARPLEVRAVRTSPAHIRVEWSDPLSTPRAYEVSRQLKGGPWEPPVAVPAGRRHHLDRDLRPGAVYLYRVRPADAGDGSWSAPVTQANLPHRLEGLEWEEAAPGAGLTFRWQTPLETEGAVRVERSPDVQPAEWAVAAESHPLTETAWTDAAAPSGARLRYRFSVVNASGASPEAVVEAFTRATGTVRRHEPFTAAQDARLPWQGAWARWSWTGQARDREPAIRSSEGSSLRDAQPAGGLVWPVTPGGARSFFFTEDVQGDFSGTGAEVAFDTLVGRGGPSAHGVAVCLRLEDGSWVATRERLTATLTEWSRNRFVLHGERWRRFDAQRVEAGAPLDAPPDLSTVRGVGLFITRPINNRWIQIDNLDIWAAGWKAD